MRDKLELIETTLQAFADGSEANIVNVDIILTQLERFFRTAFASGGSEKKGKELTEPLDAAMRISIALLETIDKGCNGLDDAQATMLRETYEKYLGPYRA